MKGDMAKNHSRIATFIFPCGNGVAEMGNSVSGKSELCGRDGGLIPLGITVFGVLNLFLIKTAL